MYRHRGREPHDVGSATEQALQTLGALLGGRVEHRRLRRPGTAVGEPRGAERVEGIEGLDLERGHGTFTESEQRMRATFADCLQDG